jgi:hypothetical protein
MKVVRMLACFIVARLKNLKAWAIKVENSPSPSIVHPTYQQQRKRCLCRVGETHTLGSGPPTTHYNTLTLFFVILSMAIRDLQIKQKWKCKTLKKNVTINDGRWSHYKNGNVKHLNYLWLPIHVGIQKSERGPNINNKKSIYMTR